MIPAVRQEKILEILSNNEIVTVESLMNELQVSVSTLRRDLIKLEGEKKITLLHGGGVRLAPKTVELNIFTKLEMNKDAKERIARKAAAGRGRRYYFSGSVQHHILNDTLSCREGYHRPHQWDFPYQPAGCA